MSEPRIAPALSGEEWARGRVGNVDLYPGDRIAIDADEYVLNYEGEECRQLAALALQVSGPERKPLFTHADVRLLNALLDGLHPDDAEATKNLAARIAALLPPHDSETNARDPRP